MFIIINKKEQQEKEKEEAIIRYIGDIEKEIELWGIYKTNPDLQAKRKKYIADRLIQLPVTAQTELNIKLIQTGIFTSEGIDEIFLIPIKEVSQKKLDILLEKAIPDKGFLRNYIDTFTEITDTPKSFLFWGAMTTLATVLGKNVFVNWETRRLYSNIWCVFLAPSGFRKGTGIDIPVKLLWDIDNDLLLPSIGSEEGLTKSLAIGKAGGRETGFIRWQEFNKILKSWNIKGSWFASQDFFTDLWDSKPFKKKLSQEEFTVGETAVSFLSACIPSIFSKYFSVDDLDSGFFGRVYLITCKSKERYLPRPPAINKEDLKKLVSELEIIKNKYNEQDLSLEEIGLDFDKWALNINKNREKGYLDAFYSRIETHCIKLAMIYEASLGGNKSISKEAFEYAVNALNFLVESAKPMISETIGLNEEQRLIRDISNYIREKRIVKKSDLMNKFKISSKQTFEIETTLIDRESIKIGNEKPPIGSRGGRPFKIYIAL